MRRLIVSAFALALVCGPADAQNRVRTETILPQGPAAPQKSAPQPQPSPQAPPVAAPQAPVETQAAPPSAPAPPPPAAIARPGPATPEVLTDLSRLPPPVARMRARILEVARSGDPEKLAALMQAINPAPLFSLGNEKDPLAYWRSNYPDSGGLEVLAILINILETGFVRIDKGTPQEMYVWPYFAFTPLGSLTAEQKVTLFRLITGADYKEMSEPGFYTFYRVGIAPDGSWRFFVSDQRDPHP
jgi:hypothetical protein